MAGEKVHGAAHSILALDGQIAGSLSSVSVQGNLLTFEPGGQFPGLKRVSGQGNVLSFEFGSGMSSAFFKWIDAFMKRSAKPRQIVLYFTDSGYEVQSARVYDNAKITELVFPKLDAASKDPVRMALTLTASKLSDRSPSGKLKLPAASGKLLCSNFKIEINSMPRTSFEPGGQFPGLKRVSGQGNVLSFEFGSGMSSAFFKWIDAFMKRSAKPRQIVLYFTDSGYEVQSARVYDNAKITELVFPKLDAASKDPVRMALTLTASKLSDRSPSGKLKLPAASGKLLCSNFKIEINSMPTERVLRINRFTVSGSRNSNLIIGVPIIDMEPFQQWFDNVVVSGSRSDRRKTGALEYLTQNLKDVGFTLSYGELRIVRFSLGSSKSKDRIASFEVEMTVSRASFDAPNALMSWPQGI